MTICDSLDCDLTFMVKIFFKINKMESKLVNENMFIIFFVTENKNLSSVNLVVELLRLRHSVLDLLRKSV